jgi:hypothetical protein
VDFLELTKEVSKEGFERVGRLVIARTEDINPHAGVENRRGNCTGMIRLDTEGEPTGRRGRRGDGDAVDTVMVNGCHGDDRRALLRRN